LISHYLTSFSTRVSRNKGYERTGLVKPIHTTSTLIYPLPA